MAVAVSGGKDSMVLLSIMASVFDGRNGIKLCCVTVDEGIGGYRPRAQTSPRDSAQRMG